MYTPSGLVTIQRQWHPGELEWSEMTKEFEGETRGEEAEEDDQLILDTVLRQWHPGESEWLEGRARSVLDTDHRQWHPGELEWYLNIGSRQWHPGELEWFDLSVLDTVHRQWYPGEIERVVKSTPIGVESIFRNLLNRSRRKPMIDEKSNPSRPDSEFRT